MLEGTVISYSRKNQYGFILPNNGGPKVIFYYDRALSYTARDAPMPHPSPNDQVLYTPGTGKYSTKAMSWTFPDILERINRLSPGQLALKQQVLGERADDWEFWDAFAELSIRREGQEH